MVLKLIQLSVLIFLTSGFSTRTWGVELSLTDYLNQVKEKNQKVNASELLMDGAKLKSGEGGLLFKPSFFAQVQSAIDKKPTTNISVQGDRTDYTFFTTGISEHFSTGLQAKLTYYFSHTNIYNASRAFLPVNDFHDGAASLELSQSLWRNWWGKEVRSQEAIITAQSELVKNSENYKIKAIMAQAESAYWTLSQMRKVAEVQMESLERAQKIKEWAQSRSKSGLAERSDFLQADANYKGRDYELKNVLFDLKKISRSANSFRGIDSEVFAETLEAVNAAKLKKLPAIERAELTDDIKVAMTLKNIARATADLAIEKTKPTFELYGSYALNGRDVEKNTAISKSFKSDHATEVVGVRFIAPLDFFTTSDVMHGYKNDQAAAEQNLHRKIFDQEEEWNDLSSRFKDAQIKLALVEKMVEAQKLKAIYERERLNKGRTVTFQVLNFEQDYAQSELARIQSETNILNIYAQLKIYGAGSAE